MKTIQDFLQKTDFSYLDISNTFDKKDYNDIWKDLYLPSQEKKAKENNLSEIEKNKAFNGLSKRGYFLCQLFDFFECKNIAEVGTAEGFQFYTFCHHLKQNGNVYTCDIRDVRKKSYIEKYKNGTFVNGTANEMSKVILGDNNKIDFFWIDGGHHNSAVLFDVIKLSKTQSSNAIWVFDDFNERFGAYNEIKFLSQIAEESSVVSLGPTASGKKNTMLILRGL